jgi:TorA maturation chaperone TorD
MSAVASPVTMKRAPSPEEAARGDFYALLARLLAAPPDAALLQDLASAHEIPEPGALADAWRGLVQASSAMDPDAAAEEYEALFAGMGKAPVSIYAGYYGGASAVEHPRVRIQNDLAALGLARPDHVTEPEDHIAGLLEAMRVLVSGAAARGPASLDAQRKFYQDHLESALWGWPKAVGTARQSNYYRHVAALAAAFAALETESFKLD